MGRTRKTAPKIWPGPECLKSRRIAPGERVVLQSFKSPLTLLARMRRDIGRGAIVLREAPRLVDVQTDSDNHWWWPRSAVIRESDHLRGLNIALARTKARARMERFLAWLDSRHAPRSLVAYVGKHLSPEVAVSSMMRADVRHYLCSVFACMGANIIRTPCPGCQPVLAASLLASPEWASLPWQADPETL